MSRLAVLAASTAALAALGPGISGCSVSPGSAPPLAAADLQTQLSESLAASGAKPKSVTCTKDLPGEVGRSVRCEVVFSDTNSVEALVTTTTVDGDNLEYETSPKMTKSQLERRLGGITRAQSVTCDSGLDGIVGDWAQCELIKDGATSGRTVEVAEVNGLILDLDIVDVLPQDQVQDLLLGRLAASSGQVPDSVDCAGDLVGEPDNTLECVVTYGEKPTTYVLTVTGVDGGTVNFSYAIKTG